MDMPAAQIHRAARGHDPVFSGKLCGMNDCEDLPKRIEPANGAGAEPADPPPAGGALPIEVGGRQGPEPTRYGDWELRGRCIDF
jgi:hypothetical protein